MTPSELLQLLLGSDPARFFRGIKRIAFEHRSAAVAILFSCLFIGLLIEWAEAEIVPFFRIKSERLKLIIRILGPKAMRLYARTAAYAVLLIAFLSSNLAKQNRSMSMDLSSGTDEIIEVGGNNRPTSYTYGGTNDAADTYTFGGNSDLPQKMQGQSMDLSNGNSIDVSTSDPIEAGFVTDPVTEAGFVTDPSTEVGGYDPSTTRSPGGTPMSTSARTSPTRK